MVLGLVPDSLHHLRGAPTGCLGMGFGRLAALDKQVNN
jgi:hypothetical protein